MQNNTTTAESNTLTTRLTETLTFEEQSLLFGWDKDVFGLNAFNIQWEAEQWHLLGYCQAQLASHVALLTNTIHVGEEAVPVSGVCSVVTLPGFQRKGFAREMLDKATAFAATELRVPFAVLFCLPRLIPLYASAGWQAITAPVLALQSGRNIELPLAAMVFALTDKQWPSGTVVLGSQPW